MRMLPITEREMRVSSRRPATYRSRCAVATLAAAAAICLLYAGLASLISSSAAGQGLFMVLAFIGYSFAVFEGTLLTADSLSAERREGTLGLLFLTSMRPIDIVGGKWLSSVHRSAYSLMAALPIPGLAIFAGGVSLSDVLLLMAAVLTALAFCAALGICVSAYSRNDSQAYTASLGLVLFFAIVWPLAACWFHSAVGGGGAKQLMLLSPAGPLMCAISFGAGPLPAPAPWLSFATILALTAALLLLASKAIQRAWQDQDSTTKPVSFGDRLRQRRQARAAASPADPKQRPARLPESQRRLWLDRNPIVWLGERSTRPGAVIRTMILTAMPFDLALWYFEPESSLGPLLLGINSFLFHMVCAGSIFNHICRSVIEDRKTGALELLITTRVSSDQFLNGRALAQVRRFLAPFALLVINDALLVLSFWVKYKPDEAFVFTLVALGWLILMYPSQLANVWFGMWYGFTANSAARGQNKYGLATVGMPVGVCLLTLAIMGMATGGRSFGDEAIAFGIGWFFCLVLIFTSAMLAHVAGRMRDDFRELVLPETARKTPKRRRLSCRFFKRNKAANPS